VWIDEATDEEFCLLDYPEAYGFIYEITYTNGRKYIGKKDFFDKITLPRNSNRKKKEVFLREKTNWKEYCGSHRLASKLEIDKKVILRVAVSKRALTYLETELLFLVDAIFNQHYLNENIGGKFFDNVLDETKLQLRKEYR